MKVLMFGWEFPPKASGGLGTHSYYLTKEMSKNADITLILRQKLDKSPSFIKVISVGGTLFNPYISLREYHGNMSKHLDTFTERALMAVEGLEFDVIHAHDWLTVLPAVRLKEITGKPLILTIHSTEWDRSAGKPWPLSESIEKLGCERADKIIAVSKKTKDTLLANYNLNPNKIEVIYNAIDQEKFKPTKEKSGNKNVLFLGRLSMFKGADHFINAAKKVLEKRQDVDFLIAGRGERFQDLIEQTINLGIEKNVKFLGYVDEDQKPELYSKSDMYVMTSVSEPFGITVLEAIRSGTSTIIPKNSGAAEIVNHCFKADFWDSHDIATKMLALLDHDVLREVMTENALYETNKYKWSKIANQTLGVYSSVI